MMTGKDVMNEIINLKATLEKLKEGWKQVGLKLTIWMIDFLEFAQKMASRKQRVKILRIMAKNNKRKRKIRYKQYEKLGGISISTFNRLLQNSNGITKG